MEKYMRRQIYQEKLTVENKVIQTQHATITRKETFDEFLDKVEARVNEILEEEDTEIINISYPDMRTAVIVYYRP